MQREGMKVQRFFGEKKGSILLFFIMIALSGLFMNSFYWPEGEFLFRRKAIPIAVISGNLIGAVLIFKVKVLDSIGNRWLIKIKKFLCKLRENLKLIGICLGSLILGGMVFTGAVYVFSTFVAHTGFNYRLLFSLMAVEMVVMTIIVMWKESVQKPEVVFVVLALIVGIYSIVVTPTRVGISWDDEIHYARTLEISNYLNGIMYEADVKNIEEYAENIYAAKGFDRESNEMYDRELNVLYESKEYRQHVFTRNGLWSVTYLPGAIGIVLGRGLMLPYTAVFCMGRMFNLLVYVALFYLAIKKVEFGKILLAAIGLIPTLVFMASSYSYDAWVVGFIALGFSYFLTALYEEKKLKYKEILVMAGAILIGCLPKAIYFPVLFPFLFMPRDKFKDSRQKKIYYASVIGTGLILVMSFMLPMLIGGAGTGDVRGGAGVNSTEQIKFILNNPLTYAKILLKFELGYTGIANAGPMLQKFAYVGIGYFSTIVSLVLFVLAFLDGEGERKSYMHVRIACLIGNTAAIVLSATAMYISFTAVGLGTIEGVQGRYLLPTVYPALYAIGIGHVTHKIDKKVLTCIPLAIIALSFILNMAFFCGMKYY